MSAAQLFSEALSVPGALVGLSVDQYHRMIEQGILEEGQPIELLDGFLVRKDRAKAGADPMTVGDEHIWAVENLRRLLSAAAEARGHYVRLQQPVVLPPDGEPEPDGALTQGSMDDYLTRKPGAADLPCVIEVADSSIHRDRGTKQRIYAAAAIGQYLIVNLVERTVEVYERPLAAQGRYADVVSHAIGSRVAVVIGTSRVEVAVAAFLPPVAA